MVITVVSTGEGYLVVVVLYARILVRKMRVGEKGRKGAKFAAERTG